MYRYPVVIHKDNDSDYGVTVPDLPGCFSAGSTLDEALAMAKEAIECHIEGLLADAEPVPAASDIGVHNRKREYKGGTWALVEAKPELAGPAKRINITLPARLLVTIDRYAESHGSNRSNFLALAASEYMSEHQ